ncbi:DNA-3-methyladenine glycosylase family protein [Mesorhizobium xinjiangense]|uniref:DNA-3-methyladenine glycosylase family protein n=1 Tax=Mesorhizobium xinjiangense TaxID=2678685 RepID=UPI0012ECBFDF|nr:DNA-3-methyladenine glycosylase [Mesorhizobium xinjiangense]
MQRIETIADVIAGLDALCADDPRLVPVRAAAGDVPLRRTEPGFASLVSIIVSQQVSRASADAILARLVKLADPLTPETIHAADDALFRLAGLSRPKQRTLRALAAAITEEGLDLEALCHRDATEAMIALTAVHGIGRWTAEIYLMFAAGHPDIFPARDIALQAAVAHAFSLAGRPDEDQLIEIAESWAPNRGVAARLFWAYYREMKGREAAPAA